LWFFDVAYAFSVFFRNLAKLLKFFVVFVNWIVAFSVAAT